ncbi:MAG: hypothetical protein QOE82_2346, partial [Thermoanaerobaculia bacterium]|nr:hypothetical protein [Thermoanaerobaculia bacterium]
MSTSFDARLIVVDKTRWPIASLVVGYWQEYDGGKENFGLQEYHIESLSRTSPGTSELEQERNWRKSKNDSTQEDQDVTQDQDVMNGVVRFDKGMIMIRDGIKFDEGHDIYWSVAWQNMHDPAIYYL